MAIGNSCILLQHLHRDVVRIIDRSDGAFSCRFVRLLIPGLYVSMVQVYIGSERNMSHMASLQRLILGWSHLLLFGGHSEVVDINVLRSSKGLE